MAYYLVNNVNSQTMKQKWIITAFILIPVITIVACNKTTFESVSKFNVKLASSGQLAVEQVNIDVQQVKVNYSDTTWVLLNTPQQVYNILDYKNGLDTVIANGTIPATSVVKQLKLVLGNNNTVKLGGKFFPLTSMDTNNELTLKVDKKLNRYIEHVTIVFDPANSVSMGLNGSYQLKPSVMIK